jgi:hypothetical protein
VSKEIPSIARRLRQELEQLRARYDSGAVMPGIFKVIRELKIEFCWLEGRQCCDPKTGKIDAWAQDIIDQAAWRALERILIDYFQRRRIEVSDPGAVTTIDVVRCYELVEDDTISVGELTELSLEELAKIIAAEWAYYVRD